MIPLAARGTSAGKRFDRGGIARAASIRASLQKAKATTLRRRCQKWRWRLHWWRPVAALLQAEAIDLWRSCSQEAQQASEEAEHSGKWRWCHQGELMWSERQSDARNEC